MGFGLGKCTETVKLPTMDSYIKVWSVPYIPTSSLFPKASFSLGECLPYISDPGFSPSARLGAPLCPPLPERFCLPASRPEPGSLRRQPHLRDPSSPYLRVGRPDRPPPGSGWGGDPPAHPSPASPAPSPPRRPHVRRVRTHPLVGPMEESVQSHLAGHIHDATDVRVVALQGRQADIMPLPREPIGGSGRHLPTRPLSRPPRSPLNRPPSERPQLGDFPPIGDPS